ncbi:MAG: MerR family transcriptional regulator [Methyloversatilis sp.]|nr:MerR family transcriptional regulator [Methyloversatilis sp.]MBP9118797.1 MerR family transcriptional regulator [Methyloversatilis sp.]
MKIDIHGAGLLSIGAVERETGLPKDTLRVWERRYGFPLPTRDEAGERLYTQEDVNRLRIVRRLVDQGWRPGKLLAASEHELRSIIDAEPVASVPALLTGEILTAIRTHDVDALQAILHTALLEKGIQGMVRDLVAPLNVNIGEAWIRGELGIPDEHFYTEQIQRFLRGTLAGYSRPRKPPRVLLTTMPEEEHALGLLMVEVMLAAEGAQCCSLGPRMPLSDIRASAVTADADIVALSFSAAYPARQAAAGTRALRTSLPEHVEIWAGGAGARDVLGNIPGVRVIDAISDVCDSVSQWRVRHAAN